jgi:hypothetical protein
MPNAGTALRKKPNPLTANAVRKSGFALNATRAETFSPGASTLVIGEGGGDGAEPELVGHWRRYLDNPDSYLRHILDQ